MLRSTLFAVLAILAAATASQAAITLQQSLSAVQPTVQASGTNLVAYDLRVVSDSGQIINNVVNPTIVPDTGDMGLHQVWTPITSSPTPTRAEQTPPLWSDTWLPYDSYFLFSNTNSLSVGGVFTETNSHSGGAALASAGIGAPNTGFGNYGFSGSFAAKFFTVASGIPDSDVTFAQLVMKAGEAVRVTMGVLHSTGFTDFENVCIGAFSACATVEDLPFVADHDLSPDGSGMVFLPGEMVMGTLPYSGDAVTWSLVSLLGPGGVDYTAQASVESASTSATESGKFSWTSPLDAQIGRYNAIIRGTNLDGEDTGVLSFRVVPEPATLSLLGLAMSLFGLGRRR